MKQQSITAVEPRGIFISGTDTGVGKTMVAAGLVRVLAGHGRRVVGLKPVASGAGRTDHGLRNADALALAAESSVVRPYAVTNPYCFEPAIAPHLAARDAGVTLSVDALEHWYRDAVAGTEIAIVEGAGGWRVPLHPEGFLSDLPERLELDVLLVVGLRLGCLNHARLTLEAIRSAGRCNFLGWVGNETEPGYDRLGDNVESLARLLGGPPLALVPWLEQPTVAAVAGWLDRLQVLRTVFIPR